MTKKILALTGTRADYGIYRPVFEAIQKSSSLSLGLIVTGMHLRQSFGHTVDIIRKDGFSIAAEIDSLTEDDTPVSTAAYVGRTLIECARVLEAERPDVLFLLGDRGEQLAGAIAALELGIPIAHLHGGESSGTADEFVRHAITHMAAIHLTTASVHAENVRRMRGSDENIHVVGAPALDVIRTFTPLSKETLCAEAGLDSSLPLLLFVQHPDPLDPLSPEHQLTPSLEAIESFEGNIMMLGANADAGGKRMNAIMKDFAAAKPGRAFSVSVPHRTFLSWEACAEVLVGNSSSGIIEAASFGLPVVNVGGRQRGRLQSGNVIDVPYDAAAIEAGIRKATSADFRALAKRCSNAYGDGHAAEKIVKILEA
jgi:UDP-hydrolysing UDP-N-acetyl-D-glucosamine 2-epimerase